MIGQAMNFKEETEDDLVTNFVTLFHPFQYLGGNSFGYILDRNF
jgi:hypothetical protein